MFGLVARIVAAPVRIVSAVVEESADVVGLKPVARVATLPLRAASGVVEQSGDAIDNALSETL